MEINTHILSRDEELFVEKIFQAFKKKFDEIELINKKNILGIGQINRELMCYFSIKNDNLYVKFKNSSSIKYEKNLNLSSYIKNTVSLFMFNNYSSSNNNIKKGLKALVKDYNFIIDRINSEKGKLNFDTCSSRLSNSLYSNKIYCIDDLKRYSPDDLISFKNFGAKCLSELCQFLLNVHKKSKAYISKMINSQNTKSEEILESQMTLKFEMLDYINDFYKKAIFIDIENAFVAYKENYDKYNDLFIDYVNYFAECARLKLTPKELIIFNARLGMNESPKTLQEIGDIHKLTRERIRQIVSKIESKFKSRKETGFEYILSDFNKCKLIEKTQELSIGGFIAFIYFESNNYEMLKFVYQVMLNAEFNLPKIRYELDKQFSEYSKKERLQEMERLFNERKDNFNLKINNLISNNEKRTISLDDFDRIKCDNSNSNFDRAVVSLEYENSIYQCESLLESKILEKFLKYKTFKKIKTHSLAIPHNNKVFYPDFQCLTYDNHLVIIDFKPILKMCEYSNIEKFNSLKEYCQKYGFGYLIIDDRNNSYESINLENEEFSKQVMNEIDKNNKIPYPVYKSIYVNTNANVKQLLSLIKNNHLKLSFPFSLTKM